MPPPLPDSDARRILVYRTGHLGDTVCAIPAFRLIRQAFPDANLTLLCDQPDGQKVPAVSVVRRLHIFNEVRTYRSRRGWRTYLDLGWQIRRSRSDLAILLSQSRETPLELGNKKRFFQKCGVGNVRMFCQLANPCSFHPTESVRLIEMLAGMGIVGVKPAYAIPVDAADRATVCEKLQAMGVDPARPFLVFSGGGKTPAQQWPLERYAQVLAGLAQEFSLPVVALGTASERDQYRVGLLPGYPALKIPGSAFSLGELFEVCRLAALYLGNDTGTMHVAAAVGCQVAAVISARNPPGAWDPDLPASARLVFRHRTFCENCFLNACEVEGFRCLLSITAEDVLAELLPFIRNIFPPPA